MTAYLMFTAFALLVYLAAALAAAISGVSRDEVDVAFHLALFASVSVALVAVVIFYASRTARVYVFAVLLMFVGAVTIVIATVPDPVETPGPLTSSRSSAVVAAAESEPGPAAGEKLFREFGCLNCHRPDGNGIGPSLTGVFGRPMTDPGCGYLTADEEYVRESILNPSAIVVPGFTPVMPTFAGRVTEDQLGALVDYVKSLKGKRP